jgi:type II secretory ATPase GspE/PulE/Tfp pilus assembly ATPase PilB-like protein
VATIPTVGGEEDVVMRILAAGEPIPLEAMGLSDRNYELLIKLITQPYGIVLVVGPTGSGKTTTLHAALNYINKPDTKIWTAEDPVEITQRGLRQVQVLPKIGFNFAAAMRSFLRADPDVIMVGEMRDEETVSTGIEASLTGHLVFSTLHTNSAPETITRLLDMGMDPFNFADALLGVLAQRLVRTLCKDCKESYHPDREEYDNLVRTYAGDFDALGFPYTEDLTLYRANGCDRCNNSGYRGRTGIVELLDGTDEMCALIQGKAKMEELRVQAVKDGMTTLMQDGIRKVFTGVTDIQQVRKVCIK